MNVTSTMTAAREAVFAPVLPVVKINGSEEALEIANARSDGLSTYLFTRDHLRFMHAVENLEVGTSFINKGISGRVHGYHNGHEHSGIGGEDGVHGIDGYLQKRTICLNWR